MALLDKYIMSKYTLSSIVSRHFSVYTLSSIVSRHFSVYTIPATDTSPPKFLICMLLQSKKDIEIIKNILVSNEIKAMQRSNKLMYSINQDLLKMNSSNMEELEYFKFKIIKYSTNDKYIAIIIYTTCLDTIEDSVYYDRDDSITLIECIGKEQKDQFTKSMIMEIKSQLKILKDGIDINNCKTCGWKLGTNAEKCINCKNFNDPKYILNKRKAKIEKLFKAKRGCNECEFDRGSICVNCLLCKGCGARYKYWYKYCEYCNGGLTDSDYMDVERYKEIINTLVKQNDSYAKWRRVYRRN